MLGPVKRDCGLAVKFKPKIDGVERGEKGEKAYNYKEIVSDLCWEQRTSSQICRTYRVRLR